MPVNLRNNFILQIIAIIFAMLNLSNIQIKYVIDFLPLFDLMIIYYFAIFKPRIFQIWFLFILGIISDAINGIPLGVTSLIYISLVLLFNALNQRAMMKENFQQIFIQFCAFALMVLLFKWLFLSFYYFKIYNITNLLIQLSISAIFYVFMHKFFDFLDRKLAITDD